MACRYRLVHLISPVLRLVLTLLAGTPGSSGLAEQATNFAAAHLDMLARILQEAASPATAVWAPGDEELEMAALAVGLVSLLPNAVAARAGALAGLRRDLWRLWLVLAGHDRKEGRMVSSIVVSCSSLLLPQASCFMHVSANNATVDNNFECVQALEADSSASRNLHLPVMM